MDHQNDRFNDTLLNTLIYDELQNWDIAEEMIELEDLIPSERMENHIGSLLKKKRCQLKTVIWMQHIRRGIAVFTLFFLICTVSSDFIGQHLASGNKQSTQSFFPDYIPEGFQLIHHTKSNPVEEEKISYQNADKQYTLHIFYPTDSFLSSSTFFKHQYHQKTYFLNTDSTIVILKNGYMIAMTHNLPQKTALKILFSL